MITNPLTERVSRLERKIRRLIVAFVVVCVAALGVSLFSVSRASQQFYSEQLYTQSCIVMRPNLSTSLTGKLELGGPDDRVSLALGRLVNVPSVILLARRDGSACLEFHDQRGNIRASFGLDSRGQPAITLNDDHGNIVRRFDPTSGSSYQPSSAHVGAAREAEGDERPRKQIDN